MPRPILRRFGRTEGQIRISECPGIGAFTRHWRGARRTLAVQAFCVAMLASAVQARAFDVVEASIRDIQAAFASGEMSAEKLVADYLARIAAYDQAGPRLNAIAAIAPDALDQARTLDAERARSGPRGPLHGIPIVVKDNYDTRDMATTAGSLSLADYFPVADAFLIDKLRASGAIILAKTNMHEFALGWEGIGSGFGQVRNPYAPERGAGGSSSGTAAAVAASFSAAGMGADTCGSIRLPAAYNGLVGLRPTRGLLSRDGIIPVAFSLDTGGPIARSAEDLALVLEALVGFDPADPETAASVGNTPASYTDALDANRLAGLRIGVLKNFDRPKADPDVTARIDTAREWLTSRGAILVEVSIPDWKALFFNPDPYYVIFREFRHSIDAYLAQHPEAPVHSLVEIVESGKLAEHGSVLPRLKGAAKIEAPGSEKYYRYLARHRAIRAAVLAVMAEHNLDVLTYPTVSGKPPMLGANENGGMINCYLASHTGFPAITVPAGQTPEGLPVGIEFLARPWHEKLLIGVAYALEQATGNRLAPASTPPL